MLLSSDTRFDAEGRPVQVVVRNLIERTTRAIQ
jgi:hypothetical protein